ncbi:MAG: hypothetical protein E7294_06045 [Lachnospiraceae bacterium]|jgi:flagellar motility protein MotE (MotC chaperone)|nr:hypothetical protein [Lachnospiraceae bacterium]
MIKTGPKKIAQRAAITLIILLSCLFVLLGKNNCIVYLGIGAYKWVRTILMICAATSAVNLCGHIFAYVHQKRKTQLQDRLRSREESDETKRNTAVLSVKEELENDRLCAMLEKAEQAEWQILQTELGQCRRQLAEMDELQDKLTGLLQTNEADSLSDTEEILEKVEQQICKNVRKVLNHIQIRDPSDQGDQVSAREKIQECVQDNEAQLGQTKEFLYALAEFLNRQGENENDVSMLQIYKETILDSLKNT